MDKVNLIFNPPDGNLELYEKSFERTKHNLNAYYDQFCADPYNQNRYTPGLQKLLDYVSELIVYERSNVRLWKEMVMEEVMENRRKKNG